MANFIQRAFGKVFGQKQTPPTSNKPTIRTTDYYSFDSTVVPEMDKKAQMEQYKSWAYACIRKIATEVADINLFLYKKDIDGENEEVETHDAIDTLHKANDIMTFYDLIEHYETMMQLTGECFWWLVKGTNGKIVKIYPFFKPYLMDVVAGDNDNLVKGYVYNNQGTGEKIPFAADEMIMFKFVNPSNPYRGVSPIKACDYALAVDDKAIKYNYQFFKNSALPDGVLKTPNTLQDKQFERLREQWENKHKGADNAHKIAILENGLEFQQVGFSQNDLQFTQYRTFTRDEILAIFNVPKSVLGITTDVNRSNAEATIAMFKSQVIQPLMKKLVNSLNEFYLPHFDKTDELFFDFDNPAPANQEMELAYYNSGLNPANPWLTVNEVRKMEGFDKIEGGDELKKPSVSPETPPGDDLDEEAITIPKQHNIRKARRTKRQMVKESLIMPENKKVLSKLLDKEKVDTKQKERDMLWFAKIAKTDKDEARMAVMLNQQFSRQEKKVLDTLSVSKSAKAEANFTFDTEAEDKLFVKVFSPEIERLIMKYGEDALRQLGLHGFNSNVEIQKWLKKMTIKFSESTNFTTYEDLNNTLAEGVAKGESMPKLSQRVADYFETARDSRSNAIARTEVARSSNYGMVEAWKQSGVVEKKEWVTAFDERTCGFCESMDGKAIGLDEVYYEKGSEETYTDDKGNTKIIKFDYADVANADAHVNCRCTLRAITSEKRSLIEMRKEMLAAKEKALKEIEATKIKAEKEKQEAAKEVAKAKAEKKEISDLMAKLDDK
jgi:HK97 family phage portal protein